MQHVSSAVPTLSAEARAARLVQLVAWAITLVIGLSGAAAIVGHLDAQRVAHEVDALHTATEDARRLLQAAVDSESAARGYVLFQANEYLQQMHAAMAFQESAEGQRIIAMVDRAYPETGAPPLDGAIVSSLATRRRSTHTTLDQIMVLREQASYRPSMLASMQIRDTISRFIAVHRTSIAAKERALAMRQKIILGLIAVSSLLSTAGLAAAFGIVARRTRSADQAQAALARRSDEVAALFRMTEMLQAGTDRADIEAVVANSARSMLPDAGGALFLLSGKRDRLDFTVGWDQSQTHIPDNVPLAFAFDECWALKRGRPHVSGVAGGLSCTHAASHPGCLCVPMLARGEISGVLQIFTGASTAPDAQTQALAVALADSVSMALANLGLREKLSELALADPLTGLFNRRFLEEAGGKMVLNAMRREAPVSVLVIDLDHFKRINDTHGHHAGDAVLRAVSAVLPGMLRTADIACRYGGEEFVLLLSDCGLADAANRAEELRRRIEQLAEEGGPEMPSVTASIGIASLPLHGDTLASVIAAADAALYSAKQAGRNRVVAAALPQRQLLPTNRTP